MFFQMCSGTMNVLPAIRYSWVYADEVKFTVTAYGPLAVAPAIGRPIR